MAADWEIRVVDLDYMAVGGGSYHWKSTDLHGARCFVTVDDLDAKRGSATPVTRCSMA